MCDTQFTLILFFFCLFGTNVQSKRTTRAEPEDHLWSADHSLRNAALPYLPLVYYTTGVANKNRVLFLLCFLLCMKQIRWSSCWASGLLHSGRMVLWPAPPKCKVKELLSLQRKPFEVRLCPWKGRIQSATVLRCRVPSRYVKERHCEGSQASPACPSNSGIRWR